MVWVSVTVTVPCTMAPSFTGADLYAEASFPNQGVSMESTPAVSWIPVRMCRFTGGLPAIAIVGHKLQDAQRIGPVQSQRDLTRESAYKPSREELVLW